MTARKTTKTQRLHAIREYKQEIADYKKLKPSLSDTLMFQGIRLLLLARRSGQMKKLKIAFARTEAALIKGGAR